MRVFLVFLLLTAATLRVNGGEKDAVVECTTDTHVQCGELIMWNETRSPASTVLQLEFPDHFEAGAGWSVHLSTCHELTTASTTIKLFDACPLAADSGPLFTEQSSSSSSSSSVAAANTDTDSAGNANLARDRDRDPVVVRSAVASNTRDRACRVAGRASSLEFAPQLGLHALEPHRYFAVASAGARTSPGATTSEHSVALSMKCFDDKGREVRAHSWQGQTAATTNTWRWHDLDNEHDLDKRNGVGTENNENDGSRAEARSEQQQGQPQKLENRGSQQGQPQKVQDALSRFSRQLIGAASAAPSASPSPSNSGPPTELPSSSPTTLPSPAPTAHPTAAPTWSPSASSGPTPPPSSAPTPLPSPLPTLTHGPTLSHAPTAAPTQDHCSTAESGVASCGSIVQGNTTGRFGYTGAVAGEVNYLVPASTPRAIRVAACPATASPPLTSSLSPAALRLYTACPFQGGVEVANSLNTTLEDRNALALDLSGGSNSSSSSPPVNLTGCAVLAYEVHAGFESPQGFWLVVDGASDGVEGLFELTVACTLIFYPSPVPLARPTPLPTPLPSPAPSSTPAPSEVPVLAPTPEPSTTPTPAPTQIHARSNCACFSEKMIENIGRHCPRLLTHFNAGCMPNVTRAVLKQFSANCTALKADWGPFFQFADDDGGSIPGYPTYN